MTLEELEDCKDDVVDVAESRCLTLLGVVEPAGPVDGDIMSVIELNGATDGAACVGLAEGVETIEYGAVLANVEALQSADLVLLSFGRDGPEEGNVVVGVETAEIAVPGRIGLVDLHVPKKAVVGEQGMSHPDTMRLHRVPLPVVVVADFRVVEVANLPLLRIRTDARKRIPAGGLHTCKDDYFFLRLPPRSFSVYSRRSQGIWFLIS